MGGAIVQSDFCDFVERLVCVGIKKHHERIFRKLLCGAKFFNCLLIYLMCLLSHLRTGMS